MIMKLERRDYTEKELAVLCSPGTSYDAARQKFRRDVNGCAELRARLGSLGWRKRKRYIPYRLARLIIEYVYPDMFDL